jgi:hypothetical protein
MDRLVIFLLEALFMGRFSNRSAASALGAFSNPAKPFNFSKLVAMAALVLLLAPRDGRAANQAAGNLGLGIIAGDPSGISGKLWTGPNNAIDFIVGFSLYHDYISINGDYVWHEWNLIPVKSGRLPLYYGMGLWTSISGSPAVGGRGIVGLEYLFPSAPLDVFLELGPGIQILPDTGPAFSAGLGMRYFF